ncbi:uncharacterized protein LOC119188841 [Manduca sexta]|uniref:uncharacterized protein LOC119188841 n=1 Tax=Manduca sexta TaxID=7130 RepID=UPI00188E43D8|nr:uncharacterized protein LOC119188841 [Manduca sexta]
MYIPASTVFTYLLNGLLMLATFFVCRVASLPYVCLMYSRELGLPYFEVLYLHTCSTACSCSPRSLCAAWPVCPTCASCTAASSACLTSRYCIYIPAQRPAHARHVLCVPRGQSALRVPHVQPRARPALLRGTVFTYLLNGLLMLATFFVCRVASLPYVCLMYSRELGLPYFEAIKSLPTGCKVSICILLLPQLYWFYLMSAGALKMFLGSAKPKSANSLNCNKSAGDAERVDRADAAELADKRS